MKKASAVLYILGIVFNIIALIAVLILMIVFCVADPNTLPESSTMTPQEWKNSVNFLRVFFITVTIIFFVILCIALWAVHALKNKKIENVPHILMIVIGVVGASLLYLLGGVFGIIGENTESGSY